jgi:DNA-binding XRE family transcriptional regulator
MGVNEFINVGAKIKQARINAGYNQTQLAKILEIPRTTYVNYENGHREPNKEVIEKIAHKLNISVSDLLGTEELLTRMSHTFENAHLVFANISDALESGALGIELEDVKLTRTAGTLSMVTEYLGLGNLREIGIETLENIVSSDEFKSFLEYLISKYSKNKNSDVINTKEGE